jgi:hypothetical protein
MAQRTVNASSITWSNQNTFANNIAVLRAKMQPGQVIFKSDILLLITLINQFGGHYHTYTDLVQQATFGNNGDRNTYQETRNTGSAVYETFPPDQPIEVSQDIINSISLDGAKIEARHTNASATKVRNLRSHNHVIFDKISR